MNINPDNAEWKPELMAYFKSRRAEVEEIYMEYSKRINNFAWYASINYNKGFSLSTYTNCTICVI